MPVVALNVTAPLPVPLAGDTVSHAALSLAVQLKVPPPVLLMLTVWAAGLLPPCWAVKEKLVGLAPIAGGTGAGDGGEEADVGGLTSCESPGMSFSRRDIERPFPSALPPPEVLVEGAAIVAPANVVVPVDELRGAIEFAVAVVVVVLAAVLISDSGATEVVPTAPVLLESELSLD